MENKSEILRRGNRALRRGRARRYDMGCRYGRGGGGRSWRVTCGGLGVSGGGGRCRGYRARLSVGNNSWYDGDVNRNVILDEYGWLSKTRCSCVILFPGLKLVWTR